ncbi:hypothetical protein [Sphingomonas sp.]|jgi:hypothetical protein|uniref:hypothetical protein n=1 Tax=Sphingomonas sp. TaxID=28214 RepID=UPI002E166CE4|nr:hypothetical protein [Sphingomonas sp.]
MAKISELPIATDPDGTEWVPIVQDSIAKRVRLSSIGGGTGGPTMVPLVSGALPGPDFLADDFGRPIFVPYVES